jgi:hypothetical protein
MNEYQKAFEAIQSDSRYQKNLDWGELRPGHPEGTVRAHIEEIEGNLETLRPLLSETEYWKLKLMMHTHDTFKGEAEPGVPIIDPRSHASIAREFQAGYCPDPDLLVMVQYHDEPFALWRQFEAKGKYNQDRLSALTNNIKDWDVFLAFNIIDGCTEGKSREPLHWFFKVVQEKVESRFTENNIL